MIWQKIKHPFPHIITLVAFVEFSQMPTVQVQKHIFDFISGPSQLKAEINNYRFQVDLTYMYVFVCVSFGKRGETGVLHRIDQWDCFFSSRCVCMSNIRTTSGYTGRETRNRPAAGLYTECTLVVVNAKKRS